MSEAQNPAPSTLQFDLDTVRQVAALLRESELGEICIETTSEDSPRARLLLRRAPSVPLALAPGALPIAAAPVEASAAGEDGEGASTPQVKTVSITSMAVGVFRPAKVPVQAGDEISIKQVVGIVESMRVPNEIVSTVAGRVLELGAQDGQGVEYGQTLFVIEGS